MVSLNLRCGGWRKSGSGGDEVRDGRTSTNPTSSTCSFAQSNSGTIPRSERAPTCLCREYTGCCRRQRAEQLLSCRERRPNQRSPFPVSPQLVFSASPPASKRTRSSSKRSHFSMRFALCDASDINGCSQASQAAPFTRARSANDYWMVSLFSATC